MVSPGSRRRGVRFLLDRGFPRTCACRVCAISRPASRHVPKERSPGLRARVLELARANPRYGFRRVHALLPGVNLKAVHRIWKEEGLGVRHRKRARLVVPKAEGPQLTGPNQAWCLDFAHERLENGRHTRILGVLDCFTRECLLLKAASSFPAFQVEKELEWLFLVHGKPAAIVSDNGPEFRAMTLPEGVSNRFIQPGKPWQNGYIESFFGKLRDELLSCELFVRGAELQAALADFQEHYNHHRPHLGLGGLTPANFKQKSQATNTEEPILYS
ncbi:MAG: IS3 family transposase [Fimbriimonadaceae bacterium]|nr:IS3 family transposase [Fimbriimonadaceae bacterium]